MNRRNYGEGSKIIKKSGMLPGTLHTFSFGPEREDGASIMILMLDMIMTSRY